LGRLHIQYSHHRHTTWKTTLKHEQLKKHVAAEDVERLKQQENQISTCGRDRTDQLVPSCHDLSRQDGTSRSKTGNTTGLVQTYVYMHRS